MHAPACLLLVLLTGTRIHEHTGECDAEVRFGFRRGLLESCPRVGAGGSVPSGLCLEKAQSN